jgi:hypothetical protein
VPCSALLASVDVISSLEASLLATFHRPLSPELLLAVLCQRVLHLFLRSGLTSSGVWCCRSCRLGSAVRMMHLPGDALPCWPWLMLCRRCCLGYTVRVMPSACGCFAVLALADALPPCRLFSVDALPPRLHLPF